MVAVEGTIFVPGHDPKQRLIMTLVLADGSYEEAFQEEQERDRVNFGADRHFSAGPSRQSEIVDALVALLSHNGVWGITPDWRGNEPEAEDRGPLHMASQISFSVERGGELFDWVASLWNVDAAIQEIGVVLATDDFGNEYTLATDDLHHHDQTRRSLDEAFSRTGRAPSIDANGYRWMIEGRPDTSALAEPAAAARRTDVAALLRAQGIFPRSFKGRKLPVGGGGEFVHYLEHVDRNKLLWERGERPDPAASETNPNDFHEAVFTDSEGAGHYLVYSEGFVEYVPLGMRHDDATFVDMGERLSEHRDDE